jgi:hypothetical protein
LPFDAVEKLPVLLREIENQKSSLGVSSYGISSPTIEEVFLKLEIIKKFLNIFCRYLNKS